ncbi:hypothetical protein [Flagellimonas iocasae]|uniref:Uncharacterized protein n=1 Tax=Flagellimonas iocasae TaxID=2055905 RepID=A0ABW4XU42_9FLAO
MNALTKIFNWKRTIVASLVVLLILIVSNFYGIYTNKFYFLKPSNYIFPLLTSIHFLYLYVVWFKISEDELPDPKMRNVELALYGLIAIYAFKIYGTAMMLTSISEYTEHVIPASFKPFVISTLVLYSVLPLMTLYLFWLRKRLVGPYNFENYNNNLNIWQ